MLAMSGGTTAVVESLFFYVRNGYLRCDIDFSGEASLVQKFFGIRFKEELRNSEAADVSQR